MQKKKFYQQLYVQVIIAALIGVLLGHFYPQFAVKMKPFGDGFIKLIKMLIAPIIFTTVVIGITNMRDMKEAGRIGIKALIYFEVMTSLALIIGLIVANISQPGAGLNIDVHSLDSKSIAHYTTQAAAPNLVDFILNIIPTTLTEAFVKGDILPVLFISIFIGFGMLHVGKKAQAFLSIIDQVSKILFAMIGFVMKIAPLGVFGAMAYTIGAFGINSLAALGGLLANVYLTCLLFIFIGLGFIARVCKFSLWQFLKYIKEELLIVLGTSSSEVVLPRMMKKLEALGCGKPVVGLVLPAGYSFNLDGTCIYLTLATLFIAQALNIDLTLMQQLTIVAVLLFTSKGAAAVTGGGFIILAATLSSLHTIPVEGIVLLLGVDRFMSEARSITNLIGNGIATIVVAKWENEFDAATAKKVLAGITDPL